MEELLKIQAQKLADLTKDTTEIFGGEYKDNLDGATTYFEYNGKKFKIEITEVKAEE